MTKWIESEDDYLKANYGRLSARQCAIGLNTNRTKSMVIGRVDRLGLSDKGQPGRPKLAVEDVPRYKHRMGPMRSMPPTAIYKEPPMPQVNDAEKLHSRAYNDLEPGMCNWPVYIEQGVQMYCAATTERLPGRFDAYCKCHKAMGRQPLKPRRSKGTWR